MRNAIIILILLLTATAWAGPFPEPNITLVSVTGPQGDTGPQGPQGEQGDSVWATYSYPDLLDSIYVPYGTRVGIGCTAPRSMLEIGGDTGSVLNRQGIQIGSCGVGSPVGVTSRTAGDKLLLWNTLPFRAGIGINTFEMWLQSIGVSGATSASIAFYTSESVSASNEQLRIIGNGNIGVDTSSPVHKLTVTADATKGGIISTDSDVYIRNATYGVILKSSGGTCFRVTVSDTGDLNRVAVTCP